MSPIFSNNLIDNDSISNLQSRENPACYINENLNKFGEMSLANPINTLTTATNNNTNPNNKPIGYERHEKQQTNNNIGNSINNSPNINNFNPHSFNELTSPFNINMAIGLQLNNLNIEDFSYLYNNLNDTTYLANQQQKKACFLQPTPSTSVVKQQDPNAIFQSIDQNTATVSSSASSDNTNSLPAFTNENIQQQQQNTNFQSVTDLSSLPLPLANQWIANMNNNIMNMNSLTNGNVGLNHRLPFINLNQSLTSLLPAFLVNGQSMSSGMIGQQLPSPATTSSAAFSTPPVELMGLQQQYQASSFNNLHLQTQFIDSLKSNNVNFIEPINFFYFESLFTMNIFYFTRIGIRINMLIIMAASGSKISHSIHKVSTNNSKITTNSTNIRKLRRLC